MKQYTPSPEQLKAEAAAVAASRAADKANADLQRIVQEEIEKFALREFGMQTGDRVEIVSKVDGSHIAFMTIQRISISKSQPYAVLNGGTAYFLEDLRTIEK